MTTPDKVAQNLPLNPRVFLILLAFAEGSGYGYQVKKAVDRLSGGQVQLDVGSLYRAIAKLVDGDLIREAEARGNPDEDDERRRYYELTPLGRDVTSAEARRLNDLVEIARVNELLNSPGSGR
jgi:DNA-binding PadR family transcriptional regulator